MEQHQNPRPLAGRRAIVTGASRGIGRELALTLAAAGADVALGARDSRSLEDARTAVEEHGVRGLAVPLDVGRAASVEEFVAAAVDGLGGLDIVVNNAGVLTPGGLLDDGDAPWLTALDVNVLGTVRMTEAAGRHLVAQGHGKVVNIASNYAFKGVAQHAAYCASKAAIVSFTRSIAVEWARHGVQVNAIAPGFIATDLNAEIRQDEVRSSRVLRSVPARRFGEVDDVAGILLPLCDPRTTFITGSVVTVDGGETAR
ncbi:MAG: SDR family NAD(P)-dependent oxidoreductase [Aeromicrobium sp.]|uniref:SDR family NAD(P)-dependent oxidoreductase n=1 Tax=Aeromicrobium sp. TaxID=1871063 RepID=UPI00261A0D44|nr:SDR family oxidoreductase [Aeromicrobium sp.]MDF1704920.1 SDR family NAD(P)-dependent oxidoreductase [Aeromicrobium sp.]